MPTPPRSRLSSFEPEEPGTVFAAALRRQIETLAGGRRIDLVDYAMKHHLSTDRARMRFDGARWFLQEIYRSDIRDVTVMKSVQCGITDYALVKSFARAEQGWAVLYVLPSSIMRGTFVANRVDRIFTLSQHYREQVAEAIGPAESVVLKHFGRGTIKFVGSNSANEFIEYPADVLVVDEFDRCDVANLELAPDRLSASALKEQVRLSTPTLRGVGVDAFYQASDRRVWMVPCGGCGERQELVWDRAFVRQLDDGAWAPRDPDFDAAGDADLRAVCHACAQPMDRLARGEWVAECPDVLRRGYRISKLFAQGPEGRPMAALWDKFREGLGNAWKMQVFHNSDLGLPYAAEGAAVTHAMLERCVDPELSLRTSGEGCTMGVDVGAEFHVRISERAAGGVRRAVYIGRVPNDAELDRLMRVYHVRCCVVDFAPETHLMRKFQERHGRKVWLCRYGTPGAEPRFDADTRTVTWCRTRSLDGSHEDIDQGRNVLPRSWPSLDGGEYAAQMMALTRVLDEKAGRYVWDEGAKADHYRHADNYDWVANDLIARNMVGGGWGARVIG